MVFRPEVTSRLIDSYSDICEYFVGVRMLFEVAQARLGSGEYGASLRSVNRDNLYSSSSDYRLSSHPSADEDTGACPYYVWFPTWLGAFYTDIGLSRPDFQRNGRAPTATLLAFVWTWIGRDDAHVEDTSGPECWLGVCQVDNERNEPMKSLAMKIWRFFRLEWTQEDLADGWITGGFHRNGIGCDLTGRWYLRREPLAALANYYGVENLVVRPLARRFTQMTSEVESAAR